MKRFVILTFILISASRTSAADSYQVTAGGGSQYIAEWGLCATVTNNKSKDLFVPTKSTAEWLAFLAATVANVSVSRQGCSCRSLLAMGNTTDGIYSIDPDGAGPIGSLNVYCDITTDGGGWTLVGRSISGGASTSFGWKSATGSPSDDANVYSVNVGGNSIGFSEMLFGSRGAGKAWGANVFKHVDLPKDFVSAYGTSELVMGLPAVVIGAGPMNMASRIGYTNQTSTFWFRDQSGMASTYGLKPFYFQSHPGPPAGWGGYIDGLQAMLMVR